MKQNWGVRILDRWVGLRIGLILVILVVRGSATEIGTDLDLNIHMWRQVIEIAC